MDHLPNLEDLYKTIDYNYSLSKALSLDGIQQLGFNTREEFEKSSGIDDATLSDVKDAVSNIYESIIPDEEKASIIKRDITAFVDVFDFKRAASILNKDALNRLAVVTYKTFESFRDDVLDPEKEAYTLSSLILKVINEKYKDFFDLSAAAVNTSLPIPKLASDIMPGVNTLIDDENDARLEKMDEFLRPAIAGEEKYTVSDDDFKNILSRMYMPHADAAKIEGVINDKLAKREKLLADIDKNKATLVDKENIVTFVVQQALLDYDKDFFKKYSRDNIKTLDMPSVAGKILPNINISLIGVNNDLELQDMLKNVPIRDLTLEQVESNIYNLVQTVGQTDVQKITKSPEDLKKYEPTKKEFLSDEQYSNLRERCRYVIEAADKKRGIISDEKRFINALPGLVNDVRKSIAKWNADKIKQFKDLNVVTRQKSKETGKDVYKFKFPLKGLEEFQDAYENARNSGDVDLIAKTEVELTNAFDNYMDSILLPETMSDDIIIQSLKDARSMPLGKAKTKPDYLEREQRHEDVGAALAKAKQQWDLPNEVLNQLGDVLENNTQLIDLLYGDSKIETTQHEYLTRVPSINLSIYDIEKVLSKAKNLYEQTRAVTTEKGESYQTKTDIDALIKAAREGIMGDAAKAGIIEYSGNLYALGPDQEAALNSIINKYIVETKGAVAMKKEAVYFNLFKEFDVAGSPWSVNKEQGVISKVDTALSIKESDLEDAVKSNGLWEYRIGEQLQLETDTSTMPVTIIERLPNRQYKVITTAGNTQIVKESQLFSNNSNNLFK